MSDRRDGMEEVVVAIAVLQSTLDTHVEQGHVDMRRVEDKVDTNTQNVSALDKKVDRQKHFYAGFFAAFSLIATGIIWLIDKASF
jgi:coenzyme F420-reducing hydrogenase beta subunit